VLSDAIAFVGKSMDGLDGQLVDLDDDRTCPLRMYTVDVAFDVPVARWEFSYFLMVLPVINEVELVQVGVRTLPLVDFVGTAPSTSTTTTTGITASNGFLLIFSLLLRVLNEDDFASDPVVLAALEAVVALLLGLSPSQVQAIIELLEDLSARRLRGPLGDTADSPPRMLTSTANVRVQFIVTIGADAPLEQAQEEALEASRVVTNVTEAELTSQILEELVARQINASQYNLVVDNISTPVLVQAPSATSSDSTPVGTTPGDTTSSSSQGTTETDGDLASSTTSTSSVAAEPPFFAGAEEDEGAAIGVIAASVIVAMVFLLACVAALVGVARRTYRKRLDEHRGEEKPFCFPVPRPACCWERRRLVEC